MVRVLLFTRFAYSSLKLSHTRISDKDSFTASIELTNVGDREGTEVVQLYIRDIYSSATRPVKELKHFEKQFIKVGETRTFRFDVDLERDLGFVDGNGKRFLEAGEYNIWVQDQKVKIELID